MTFQGNSDLPVGTALGNPCTTMNANNGVDNSAESPSILSEHSYNQAATAVVPDMAATGQPSIDLEEESRIAVMAITDNLGDVGGTEGGGGEDAGGGFEPAALPFARANSFSDNAVTEESMSNGIAGDQLISQAWAAANNSASNSCDDMLDLMGKTAEDSNPATFNNVSNHLPTQNNNSTEVFINGIGSPAQSSDISSEDRDSVLGQLNGEDCLLKLAIEREKEKVRIGMLNGVVKYPSNGDCVEEMMEKQDIGKRLDCKDEDSGIAGDDIHVKEPLCKELVISDALGNRRVIRISSVPKDDSKSKENSDLSQDSPAEKQSDIDMRDETAAATQFLTSEVVSMEEEFVVAHEEVLRSGSPSVEETGNPSCTSDFQSTSGEMKTSDLAPSEAQTSTTNVESSEGACLQQPASYYKPIMPCSVTLNRLPMNLLSTPAKLHPIQIPANIQAKLAALPSHSVNMPLNFQPRNSIMQHPSGFLQTPSSIATVSQAASFMPSIPFSAPFQSQSFPNQPVTSGVNDGQKFGAQQLYQTQVSVASVSQNHVQGNAETSSGDQQQVQVQQAQMQQTQAQQGVSNPPQMPWQNFKQPDTQQLQMNQRPQIIMCSSSGGLSVASFATLPTQANQSGPQQMQFSSNQSKSVGSTADAVLFKSVGSTAGAVLFKSVGSTADAVLFKSVGSTADAVLFKSVGSTADAVLFKSVGSTAGAVLFKSVGSTADAVFNKSVRSTTDAALFKSVRPTTNAALFESFWSTANAVLLESVGSTTDTALIKSAGAVLHESVWSAADAVYIDL